MYGGPQTNFESDVQPSCRSSLPNISTIPFLDMSSFQPPAVVTTNRQSGFESMESMDSDLNSGKTTPMNYMRNATNLSRITDPIRNKSHDSEDGNIGNFLRSSAPAGYDSAPGFDSLDIETFGEVATYRVESGGDLTPEPWIESSPLTARESLRQFQPSATSVTNQFGMEHLNLAPLSGSAPASGLHNAYQPDQVEPYYAHDSRPYGANLDDGYHNHHTQGQSQSPRPLSYPPHGHLAPPQPQQQYQQQQGQGQVQGQYGGHGHPYSQQQLQQGQNGQGGYATTPRMGAVGAGGAAPPRRTSHPPSGPHAPNGPHGYQHQGYSPNQGQAQGQSQSQGQGQGQGQGQYAHQYTPHNTPHNAPHNTPHGAQGPLHQYNHGSYASAQQTPLSVYRALQNQGQGQGQGQGQYVQYAHSQYPSSNHHQDYDQHHHMLTQAHTHSQGPTQTQGGGSLNQGLRSHSHSSEEDQLSQMSDRTIQPFGRVSRDFNDAVPGGRVLYPGQPGQSSGVSGGVPSAPVRTPKMGAAYSHHTAQHQHQGQAYPTTSNTPSATTSSATTSSGMGGMLDMQQELVYQVQFKRNCRAFTLSARAGVQVAERDFVVVEADRGEDIGIVVEIMTMHAFLERRMNAIRPAQPQESEDQNVGCILRLATLHERQQLSDKFHAEKDIVQSCNDLAQHGFGLPITVFEAEFQFDRRKLTVYYDCTVRIDFRDFVRQLYSTYKARIWMKKMSPTAVPEIQPFAAMALATGVQFSVGDK